MAELLGTVVGVVSLGLQVCSGITKYLGGIKGHEDEIASASRLCQSLQGAVDQIQAMRKDIAAASSGHDIAIEQAMLSANAELAVLRTFVDEVRLNDDASKSISEWIKDRTNRVTYPFRRGYLDRLESQLSEANKALQSALQVAQLYVICQTIKSSDELTASSAISLETGNAIRGIGDEVSRTSTELNNKLDILHQISTEDHRTMGSLSDEISQLSLSLETFVPHAQRHMEASSVQFTRMESRMEEVLSALASTDSETILRRVLTKPDALRLACAEVETGQRYSHSLISPQTVRQYDTAKNSMFGCRCHPRRVRRQMKQGFRSAFMTAESLEERLHAPFCPLAEVNPTQKSWTLGVSTKVFRTLLSTAITVSASSTVGAGGLSICPSFRMYFVRDQSPAEAIIRAIQKSTELDDESFSVPLQKGIQALQWIFKSGRASPLDMNANGSNLLASACDGYHTRNAFSFWKLKPLLEFLVALGVPRDSFNNKNQLPFQNFVSKSAFLLEMGWIGPFRNTRYEDVDFALAAVDHQFLMPDDISVISDYPSINNKSANPLTIKFYHEVARVLPEMTEWCGNALHAAIRRKDEVTLVEILKKDTGRTTLWENDTFGYASVELLAPWARGLELALTYCRAQILESEDYRVGSVLSYALSGRREICSASSPARCPQTCVCADNVVMLLEADCLIQLDDELLKFILEASTRCQEAVIGCLKKRRQELAYLALDRLSPKEIKNFGISKDTVLDIKTHEVVHALKRRNAEVPQWLETQVVSRFGDRFPPRSLYHLISSSKNRTNTRNLLNVVYSHGFGGVDVPDYAGFTPSMITGKPPTFINLVKMGADPTRQVPGAVAGFTSTHVLFGDLGSYVYYNDIRMMVEVKRHIQMSHTFPSEDECTCECTASGCHPYSMSFKMSTTWYFHRGNNWRQRLDQLLWRMKPILDEYWEMPEDFKFIALRMATFESLSIRHTCCRYRGRPRDIDDEDIQEFLEEDSRAIETLHELLPEFEAKRVEMSCSFSEFLGTYWKDRMVTVLEELNEPQPLTADNLREIRRLGVNLQVEDNDDEEAGPEYRSLEYYMAELDKVMEEIEVYVDKRGITA